MSRIVLIIIISIITAILLFIGLLYYTLRTKVKNVSNQNPYTPFLHKKITLLQNCVIALNYPPFKNQNPYILVEKEETLYPEAKPKYPLAKGTIVTLSAAKTFTNGTSGFEHSYVLGKVFIKELNKEVDFEYEWGTKHNSLSSESKEYWTFPQALWQESTDTTKYYF